MSVPEEREAVERFRGRAAARLAALAVLLAAVLPGVPGRTAALPGDVLIVVNEPEPLPSGIGIGVDYDGSRILYTHYQDPRILFTDLSGADLGALALMGPVGPYTGDCCNAIAYSWSDRYLYGGGWASTSLSRVDLTTGIVTLIKDYAVNGSDFIDGLAWDPTSNTFWMSSDVSCYVEHLDIDGSDIGGFNGCDVTGFGNSGLTVGL